MISTALGFQFRELSCDIDSEAIMLDRTIPFYNTIMKCSDSGKYNVELPDGFSIVSIRMDMKKKISRLHHMGCPRFCQQE